MGSKSQTGPFWVYFSESLLQWKTVHVLSMLFSTFLDLLNEDHKKRLILLVSRRNLCLMILHFRLFYFHHQPAHFCLFFPLFLPVVCSLYLSHSALMYSFSRPHWMQSHSSVKLFWESKCHSIHITFSPFCHGEAVGNFDLVPRTHTNTYTHTMFDLIWFGIQDAWALAHNAAPNVTAILWQ